MIISLKNSLSFDGLTTLKRRSLQLKFQIDTSISISVADVVRGFGATITPPVAGGRSASVVMAAKPPGKFDTCLAIFMNALCLLPLRHERVYPVTGCQRRRKRRKGKEKERTKNIANHISTRDNRLSSFR